MTHPEEQMNVAELEKLLAETTRSPSGETVAGISVVAYIEDKETTLGVMPVTSYHWSTPGKGAKNLRRLFAEEDVIPLIQSLARRVIAAEKLVEALNRIKYQNVHPDVFPRMAAEALTAYEATK